MAASSVRLMSTPVPVRWYEQMHAYKAQKESDR
jgi:hypothetical protein